MTQDISQELVEQFAYDLSHVGELSMLYRCEVADTLRALSARVSEVEVKHDALSLAHSCAVEFRSKEKARAEAAEAALEHMGALVERLEATEAERDALIENNHLKADAIDRWTNTSATQHQEIDALQAKLAVAREALRWAQHHLRAHGQASIAVDSALDTLDADTTPAPEVSKPAVMQALKTDEWPEIAYLGRAVIRFPNGVESGNWQSKPSDETIAYAPLARVNAPEVSVREAARVLGPIADLLPDAVAAAEKAMIKFPQPNYVISKWAEETGEVTKALIHAAEGRETWSNLRGEIVQSLAMLHRLMVEGDQVHGLPALRALAGDTDHD